MSVPKHYRTFVHNHDRADPSGQALRMIRRLFATREQLAKHGRPNTIVSGTRAFALRMHQEAWDALARHLVRHGLRKRDARGLLMKALAYPDAEQAQRTLAIRAGQIEKHED